MNITYKNDVKFMVDTVISCKTLTKKCTTCLKNIVEKVEIRKGKKYRCETCNCGTKRMRMKD